MNFDSSLGGGRSLGGNLGDLVRRGPDPILPVRSDRLCLPQYGSSIRSVNGHGEAWDPSTKTTRSIYRL